MKILFTILLLIGLSNTIVSQRQKVYSIVKQPQSVEWYTKQHKLWNDLIKKEPKNTNAWENSITALRMIMRLGGGKTQKDLDAFILKMEKEIPNTYEYYALAYENMDRQKKDYSLIEKARKIDSKRADKLYVTNLTHFLLKGNTKEVKKHSIKWFESNEYSASLLNYGYNMLASCEDESVLITGGDNDTYSPIIVQNALNYKPNVKVLNSWLLLQNDYRKIVFKSLNIKEMEKGIKYKTSIDLMKAIMRHLEKNLTIPLYYNTGCQREIYKDVKDKTYVVGLVLKYSDKNFDNIGVLKNNIENIFLTDYILTSFVKEESSQIIMASNNGYLTGFITLYDHYKTAGNIKGKLQLEKLLRQIAKGNPNEEYILNYIK